MMSWPASPRTRMRPIGPASPIVVALRPRTFFAGGQADWAASEIPYGVVDGANTDSPPSRGFVYVPDVAGGTTLMYNLQIGGKRVTNLRLSGATIAGIFTNKITMWNDPAIVADNPGLTLPAGGTWHRTPPALGPVDLDLLPSPFQLDLMADGAVAYLETFRGCPLSCRFCEWGTDRGRGIFSADYIAQEMRAFARLQAPAVFLLDAGLNLNIRAFRNLRQAAAETGFLKNTLFWAEIYPTAVRDEHLDFLREVGPAYLGVGLLLIVRGIDETVSWLWSAGNRPPVDPLQSSHFAPPRPDGFLGQPEAASDRRDPASDVGRLGLRVRDGGHPRRHGADHDLHEL